MINKEFDEDFGHYARNLNRTEYEKINTIPKITDFQQNKLETEAKKNWDLFYKRNTSNFFKDRHWTKKEFNELTEINDLNLKKGEKPILVELGCGVGNFFFPLIEEKNFPFYIYGCDFSKRAIDILKTNYLYDEVNFCTAFVSDITDEENFERDFLNLSKGKLADIISLIFVLSSINPSKMVNVIRNAFKILKNGGKLIFRDYGLYDHAMIRFNTDNKISKNFYVRNDGTRAFYFSEEFLTNLFESNSFKVISNNYVQKETKNKKENLHVKRIFIQAKFLKPF